MESIKATCPVFKMSNLYHHFSITHTGLVIMIPSFYLWNWLQLREWQNEGKSPVDRSIPTGWLQVFVRITGFVIGDYIITDAAPKLIFGTKNLSPFPGDMVKKSVMVFIISWFLFTGSDKLIAHFTPQKAKVY